MEAILKDWVESDSGFTRKDEVSIRNAKNLWEQFVGPTMLGEFYNTFGRRRPVDAQPPRYVPTSDDPADDGFVRVVILGEERMFFRNNTAHDNIYGLVEW